MNKVKEVHLWTDLDGLTYDIHPLTTMEEVEYMMENSTDGIIHTTIPHFLQFYYAERLFVHCYCEVHEITKGDNCEGTARVIREGHNIEHLLFAGEFDWYKGYNW